MVVVEESGQEGCGGGNGAFKTVEVAFRSATLIATMTRRVLSMKMFGNFVYPLSGYCVLVSGLVLCDMCGRFGEGWRREEVRGWVEDEVVFLRGIACNWKIVGPWACVLENE
ncbi:hypothetical protein HDU67_001075, partial [Dinochytrium kinnereticum]